MFDFHKLLQNLGLSAKEAKVYEAALELGPATVQQISARVKILRTSVYTYIKALMKKGLMSSFKQGKKTYFSAESPENLERFAETRKKELLTAASEFKKMLPKLNALFLTADERPHVRFFEGKEGLLSLISDFTKAKFESAEEFVNMDKAYAFSPPNTKDHRHLIRKKIKKATIRILYTSEKEAFLKPKENNIERRFIPLEQFPYSGSLTIYGRKAALISQNKHLVGVIIENKEIADTLRVLFNAAWKAAKED